MSYISVATSRGREKPFSNSMDLPTDCDIEVEISHSQAMIGQALGLLLASRPGIRVVQRVGMARNSRRLVIADYATALHLLEFDRELNRLRVLVLAPAARESEVTTCMQAGACAYLVLDCPAAEIEDAIRKVASGGRYVCRDAAACIAASYAQESLTRREQAVLELVANGLCNKTIARQLDLSIGTIKTHVRSVLHKLGASTRTQAARLAYKRGLVVESSHFKLSGSA